MAKCEKCSCDSTDVDVYKYPAYEAEHEKSTVLCAGCAADDGFCPTCGWFVAGSGDENWRGSGICYECYSQLETNFNHGQV